MGPLIFYDKLLPDENSLVGQGIKKEVDNSGTTPQIGYRCTGDGNQQIMGFRENDRFNALGLLDPRFKYPNVDPEVTEVLEDVWKAAVNDLRNSGVSQITVSATLELVPEVIKTYGFEVKKNLIGNLLLKHKSFQKIPGLAVILVKKL